jgi:hypothetical protein
VEHQADVKGQKPVLLWSVGGDFSERFHERIGLSQVQQALAHRKRSKWLLWTLGPVERQLIGGCPIQAVQAQDGGRVCPVRCDCHRDRQRARRIGMAETIEAGISGVIGPRLALTSGRDFDCERHASIRQEVGRPDRCARNGRPYEPHIGLRMPQRHLEAQAAGPYEGVQETIPPQCQEVPWRGAHARRGVAELSVSEQDRCAGGSTGQLDRSRGTGGMLHRLLRQRGHECGGKRVGQHACLKCEGQSGQHADTHQGDARHQRPEAYPPDVRQQRT